MNLEELIFINQLAQGVIEKGAVFDWFYSLEEEKRRDIIRELWTIIVQAHLREEDVLNACDNIEMKYSKTPVQILLDKKRPLRNRGYQFINLPKIEFEQSILLLLECFVIVETRKREDCLKQQEKCNHWWHQDLSNKEIVDKILTVPLS